MEILYARRMGFCHGVKKAFEGAMAIAGEALSGESCECQPTDSSSSELGASAIMTATKVGKPVKQKPTYILGEIVHNKSVVERIESYGIKHVNSLDEIADEQGRVIIRAHGGTREQMKALKERGLEVLDLTCTVVTKVREKAINLGKRHPAIIILGKKNHPEVIGLFSWLENPFVVTVPEDITTIPHFDSVGVVSQTTFSRDKIDALLELIRNKFRHVEYLDTVCPHTDRNQSASLEIAAVCDLMLVIGDTHSSNSKRLYEVVKRANENTYFISSSDDLKPEWFPEKESLRLKRFKVGITAGASTPDWIVEEVAERARAFG